MDFFEAQERSRRLTRTLIAVYLVATLAVALAVSAIVGAVLMWTESSPLSAAPEWLALRAPVLLGIGVVTLIFIGVASLYRVLTLRGGGARVARDLGGTPVPPDTQDPMRRRLRNVVEEMAIASGVPVPEVYVLEQEAGINAFAAGYRPEDAAVAVTRGALEQLGRDELQGVIAHEFSHILNGDMRMNIRLMGPLFGIMVIGLIGRSILRNVRTGGRRVRAKGNGVVLVLVVALGLTIIGYVGVMFARMIKSAVSRQREFLADASAVQFTRHPLGLAGALKKILGFSDHSYLQRAEAEEVSHMLFAPGTRLAGLFATHPPLNERIKRLDKSWTSQAKAEAAEGAPARAMPPESIGSFELPPAGLAPLAGNPGPAQLAAAHALHRHVPPRLYEAAHSNDAAFLLVLALILHPDAMPRREQLKYLQSQLGATRTGAVEQLYEELARSGSAYRLPLLDLAFPALRNRPDGQLEYLNSLVDYLAHQDGRVELFEYALARVLCESIQRACRPGVSTGRRRRPTSQQQKDALHVLFAAVAVFGQDTAARAKAAWAAGLARMDAELAGNLPEELPVRPGEAGWQERVDTALKTLLPLKPLERRRIVEALAVTALQDGWMSVAESELLRAVCAVLDCPLPPLYAQAAEPLKESTEPLRSLSP